MKRIRRQFLGIATAMTLMLMPVGSAHGQASELVATDNAGGTQAGVTGIGSLDLYDNSIFWTVFGGSCSGEFTAHASVATLVADPPFGDPHYVAQGCVQRSIGGAMRDDTFMFYTTPSGVMRKPLGAGPGDNPRLVGFSWNDLTPGAMMIFNGRAYYSYHTTAGPIGGRGYFVIEYFDLPGSGGSFQPITEVSHGDGLGNVGRIKKMGIVNRRLQGSGPNELSPFGLALTEYGYLLRFFVDQTIPQWRTASIIATGATDFTVRREQFFSSDPFRPIFQQDQLYVSVGTSKCPSDPPSRIITLDPITFATANVWSYAGYISAIASDSQYLFASTYERLQLGGIFGGCDLIQPGVIRSKCLPASVFGQCTGPNEDPNWGAIELSFAGDNLRSDGQWLYFTRGKQVRRMHNNAAAARQDLIALGLEAVQVVQDMNNSVRLVEGKRTIVRAYAQVAESSSVQTDWLPNAQLRGFRNGVELPGPIFPVGNTKVSRSGDLSLLRTDLNRSYQFLLPDEWVRSGRLTLRFTVNPNLATPEFVGNGDPLANNTSIAENLSVVQVRPPCFVFASIHSLEGENYWPWEHASDFASIMERAKSMLPVPDIHIHLTTERVSDEKVCFRTCSGPFGIPYPCGFICNDPFDLSNKAGWKEALKELAAYDSFDQNRPGCGRTHYVGAVHPNVKDVAAGGLANRPGSHFMVYMGLGDLLMENMPWAGRTMAHELGHNLGRMHVDQSTSSRACGGSTPENSDPSYPGDTCTFSGTAGNPNIGSPSTPMGFDTINFKPVRPDSAGDLMSYAPNRWPSVYTYSAMFTAIGFTPSLAPAAAPPPGPYVLVRGLLNLTQGSARLDGCYSLPDGVADSTKIESSLNEAAAQGGHGYAIRKLNAAGTVLSETPLVVTVAEDLDDSTSVINQFITKPAGMTALQIVHGGAVLAEGRATLNAPTVRGVTAVYNAQGPSLAITIDAVDADRDPLRFTVQFSNDDGVSWRTLRLNEGSLSFVTSTRFLSGGTRCRVRVIASDGFNTGIGTSAVFALPGHGPEPFIGGVRAGQRLLAGTTESLLGFALDAEDGSLPSAGLTWNLAGPTPKTGTGASLSLQGLSPGVYTATLSATDAHNNPASTTLTFEIAPLVIAESSVPVVDGEAADTAYADAVSLEMPSSPRTRFQFVHAEGNLYAVFTDLPYGSATVRGRIGLHIDADGSGGAAVQSSDVAFYVDEDGVPVQYEGNGTQMALRSNPAPGVKATISRGQNGWNAEFRIADSLINGWNHAARIGVFNQSATAAAAWPAGMGVNSPNTWAPVWLGSTPPAPPNRPPVAKATAPRYADGNGPTTIALDGSASFDPEGGALTYAWTQMSGPSVSLENRTTVAPTFIADVANATTFKFRLVVNDGQLDSPPSEVEVTLTPAISQPASLPPAATRNPDGSVTVSLGWPGTVGDVVIVQASTDLVHWENIATNTVNALQVAVFTDSRAGLYQQRFYRLAGRSTESTAAGGTALRFDGVDDWVEFSADDAFNTLPLTITAWIKTSQTLESFPGIVSKYEGEAGLGYAIGLDHGYLTAWYYVNPSNRTWDLGVKGGMPFVADGEWHHVAYVVDATGGRVYLDSALVRNTPWVGTAGRVTTPVPLRFGVYFGASGKHFDGELEDVTLWSRALTQAELQNQMIEPSAGTEAGLLGHWRLDEAGGAAVVDATAGGRNGTLRNGTARIASTAPIYSSAPTWTGLQFDGVDDLVRVPSSTALNAFPLTVSLWVKTTDAGSTARGLCTKYADSSFQGYGVMLSDGNVRAWYFRNPAEFVWDGGLGLNGGFVADGRWHHIVFVVDAASGRLYVDGTLRSTLGWSGNAGPTFSTEPLQFGRYFNYPVALGGQLDEIAIWNRALTSTEIQRLAPGRPSDLSANLVGYWSLNEGPGETVRDNSGNGRAGTMVNGPTRVLSTAPVDPNPVAGSALRFDGVEDAVSIAHNAALNAFPLTITAWVKTSQISPGYVGVANKYPAGSGNGYSLHIQSGRLYGFFFRGDGTSFIYPGDPGLDGGFIADGRWHHVAFVADMDGGRIHVDGVQTASLGWAGTAGGCTTTAPIMLGYYPFLEQRLSLEGRLDEITIWNRGLNAAEIGAVMNFKRTGNESGLVGYWPLDDGTGTTARDATGHGYSGTLLNGPTWVGSDVPLFP